MQYRVWHHFFLSTLHAVVHVGNSVCRQISLVNTELNKLRRQLQRLWRRIKIELLVRLSALRWFYVRHVHKIGFSLDWYKWFSCRRQKLPPRWVPHVQHDPISSFNQLNHWFMTLSSLLPSSFRTKLPDRFSCSPFEWERSWFPFWHPMTYPFFLRVR